MYFDTHAHYDDRRFDQDRDALLAALPAAGISLVLNPGSSIESSHRAITLADAHAHVYAAVGVHPHDARTMTDASVDTLRTLSHHPKVMAIGEIGLDYHYDFSPRDVQRKRFREQLDLAQEVDLPVILHQRESTEDMLEILQDYRGIPGVVHCFSGSVDTARTLLDLGLHLSFTGVITYKNARKSHEVLRYMPMDRLMLETDAPYLTPEPNRGKRNDSTQLSHIAEAVATIRGLSVEDVARITTETGKQLFRIA